MGLDNSSQNNITENLSDTHTEYYIDFQVTGEVCSWDNTDKSEAKEHTEDALKAAIADLSKEIADAINNVLPNANAKTKVNDDQAYAEGDGSVAILVYINKELSRKDAFKGIANAVDCVGIGSGTFETYDYDNGYKTGYGDNIPVCYQGWTEYPEIEATVDVQLTVTDYVELDDDGFPIER